jgi:hypothetical protein
MVFSMPNGREWDVTVGGRVEHVTDHEVFPDMFRAALAKEDLISIVQFNRPTSPHTTSVVVRLTAISKKKAEHRAREILLRVFSNVANDIIGDASFGWTLSVDAKPVSDVGS